MTVSARSLFLPSALALLGPTSLSACTLTRFAEVPPAHGRVVAADLSGPQGVFVEPDGSVYVVDSGTAGSQAFADGTDGSPPQFIGNTAEVVRVAPSGARTVLARLPSIGMDEFASGANRVLVLGGRVYVSAGDWTSPGFTRGGQTVARPVGVAALVRVEGGTFTEEANVFAFEQANNPDGGSSEGPGEPGLHAHPYGLAASADGKNVYIADAGANALLRFDVATKTLSLVTAFAPIEFTPEGGQKVTVQAVPTGVTIGRDGGLYVSLFPGDAPAPEGQPPVAVPARIVRVDPQSKAVTTVATNLASLTDVQLGPDGNLYALSFASGFAPNSGSVTRVKANGQKEVVLAGLDYPTSLAFNARGDAFVAVGGLGAPKSGRVLRYDFLTSFGAL